MTQHALDRLNSRVHPQHRAIAGRLLELAGKYSDAAIIAPAWHNVSLVVIVREYRAVIVLYRDNGRVTPSHLRVSEVITL